MGHEMYCCFKIFVLNEMNQYQKATYHVFHKKKKFVKCLEWENWIYYRESWGSDGVCVYLYRSGVYVKEYFSKLSYMKILLKCGKGTRMKRRKKRTKRAMEMWNPILELVRSSYIPYHFTPNHSHPVVEWGLLCVPKYSRLYILLSDF